MGTQPAPIAVAASGNFLGNDGAWSTFNLNIGTPPQTIQVLASTQQSATWAVAPKGCGDEDDAANCTEARGGLFDTGKSSSWFRKDIYQLNEGINLGFGGNEQNGTYGFDTIGIQGPSGSPSPSLDQQVIAGITTHKFYLGSIGLTPQTVNFSNSRDSSPSLISSLKEHQMIPSLSYGYTAGASYKDKGGDASLVIGGYDSAKFQPNELEFEFATDVNRQLVAGLQGISYNDGKEEKRLLQEGVFALVDSTVPYLWLPQSACEAFEDAFDISWDPIKNLYLVKSDAHDNLVKTNPTLTFSLATGGKSVNITFPYAAFDLNASYPLVKNESRYFPLQRAPDDRSYTLGRTFLQEAYIITNFETSTFSLSQALFDGSPSRIVPISANANGTADSGVTGAKAKGKGKSGGIGTGAIAGLAIAIAIVGIIIAVVAFMLRRRRKNRKQRAAEFHQAATLPPSDVKTVLSTARTSTDDPEPKKLPDTNVSVQPADQPMTPPMNEMEGNQLFAPGPSQPQELPGERISRGELSSSTDLVGPPSELPSPGFAAGTALRSELSTPEPILPSQELPTPDPSAELPSPNLKAVDRKRPQSYRMDSSGSESSFGRDVLGVGNHRRAHSDESRPQSLRHNSDDSIESPILGSLSTNVTDIESPVFGPSKTESPVAATGRSIQQLAKRPAHIRQDSDTFQTRLQAMRETTDESDPPSRFSTNTIKENTRKGSEHSEIGTVSSLGDSPVARKPVPLPGSSADLGKATLHEEDEEKPKQ